MNKVKLNSWLFTLCMFGSSAIILLITWQPYEKTRMQVEQVRHLIGLDDGVLFVAVVDEGYQIIHEVSRFEDAGYGDKFYWHDDQTVVYVGRKSWRSETQYGSLHVGGDEAVISYGYHVRVFDSYEDAWEWSQQRRNQIVFEKAEEER